MSTTPDDALVIALARAIVERAAPEELLLFPAASEAYLEGLEPMRAARGDPMLGFGVETAVVLITPIALTVARDVLGFLRARLKEQAAKHGDEAIDWLVARLLGRGEAKDDRATDPEPTEQLELTDDQIEQVRELALEKAKQLELSDEKAKLLADSLVGSLATA